MQKFKKGDLVRIAKNLGDWMSHFSADCDAIVIGSYHDQFGGGDTKEYTLYIKDVGECSWYYERQLTLIKHNQLKLLREWKEEEEMERKQKSNLDWIFSHGKEVLEKTHYATIEALAFCLGIINLWGARGEGFVYYANARAVLLIAKPFLEKGDKKGWLNMAEKIKEGEVKNG